MYSIGRLSKVFQKVGVLDGLTILNTQVFSFLQAIVSKKPIQHLCLPLLDCWSVAVQRQHTVPLAESFFAPMFCEPPWTLTAYCLGHKGIQRGKNNMETGC